VFLLTCRPRPSVGLSVCVSVWPESVLWQNGWLDPDTVWDGEWGRSRDGCIRWGWWSSKGKGQFCGWILASHCNQWGLCCVVVRAEVRAAIELSLGRWVVSPCRSQHWFSIRGSDDLSDVTDVNAPCQLKYFQLTSSQLTSFHLNWLAVRSVFHAVKRSSCQTKVRGRSFAWLVAATANWVAWQNEALPLILASKSTAQIKLWWMPSCGHLTFDHFCPRSRSHRPRYPNTWPCCTTLTLTCDLHSWIHTQGNHYGKLWLHAGGPLDYGLRELEMDYLDKALEVSSLTCLQSLLGATILYLYGALHIVINDCVQQLPCGLLPPTHH